MSWRLPICFLPLALVATCPLLGESSGLPDEYISESLPNGLRVSILPDAAHPVVATQLWYRVGSANESASSRGFAHLFEHLMFGGTTQYDKDAYAQYHHRFGGYENAYTSFDETVYVSQIAPEHHDEVLAMEADRMVNLLLSDQNLDNEKRIVAEELRLRTKNDPFSRVMVATLKAVLGDHPYAHTPVGTLEDIAVASLEHSREFYADYYRPRNAHLVIVGPINGADTLAAVERYFGELPAEEITPHNVVPVIDVDLPAIVELEEDLPPVETVLVAYPLPPADSEDRWALLLLRQLLGGGAVDPLEEILVKRREKALYAGVEWQEMRRGGALIFTAAFLPHRRQKREFGYVDEAISELAEFGWLTDDSLAAAKRQLIRRENRRVYFAASRADAIGRAAWWYGDERLAFTAANEIANVRLDEVSHAFERYVSSAEPVRVYIEPERVPLWVRLFGWLYPLFH
ncbi:MAG: insulinase family protein [Acidobacteriota bacterium]|nr:MAG: insulinase family protein [Acidobacteriota bacterium]